MPYLIRDLTRGLYRRSPSQWVQAFNGAVYFLDWSRRQEKTSSRCPTPHGVSSLCGGNASFEKFRVLLSDNRVPLLKFLLPPFRCLFSFLHSLGNQQSKSAFTPLTYFN